MLPAVAGNDDTLSLKEADDAKVESAACLFLEMECERPLVGPERHSLAGVERVRLGRAPRRASRHAGGGVLELEVPDGWMSKAHAEIVRRDGGFLVRDLGSKNGTFVEGERVDSAELLDHCLLQLGQTFFRFRAAVRITRDAPPPDGPAGLSTLSPRFGELILRCRTVARSRVPVLLHGESGTGKEVLARAIHGWSGRSGAFVAVNCGAIPKDLVESELFGHRKGAFSGADRDYPGLIRGSDRGPLFLDEIGDLPQPAQAALLRTLQESEVQPVGGTRPERVDLRVLAATHRNLDRMVRAGDFREDLLARLSGVTLELPPVRDRSEDIALLVATLLRKLAPERPDVKLSPDAARALLDYDWPLNVREIEQALAGALALSGVGPLTREHLPPALRNEPAAGGRELTDEELRHREELIDLLCHHKGNLSAVARAVGKGRTQVVRWIARYGIELSAYRPGG